MNGALFVAGEIALFLVLAFLLGMLVGWLARKPRLSAVERDLEKANVALDHAKAQLEKAVQARIELEAALEPSSGHGLKEFGPREESFISTIEISPGMRGDLKQIKGIGPNLEKRLNALGITTLEQVASLDPDQIDGLAEALEYSPDRIRTDDWIGSARRLRDSK